MPFIYDATMKEMVGMQTPDYTSFFHLPQNCSSRLLNVDLSTISAATDTAIGFGDPLTEIVDLNFQAGPDTQLPDRGLLYSAALQLRYRVPVRTIFVLLSPKANLSKISGAFSYECGNSSVQFRYEVVRLWEQPAEIYLNAGVGVVPLAVLGALPDGLTEDDALRMVASAIEKRLVAGTTPENAVRLMRAAYHLTRLRIPADSIRQIFGGVSIMQTAYEEMVEEIVKRYQKLVIRMGSVRLGPPEPEVEAAVRSISDYERLERMIAALLSAKDWQELLGTW